MDWAGYWVDKYTIHASSGPQGTLTHLTITLASGARVWEKTTSSDFSAIRVGDEITVRGYRVAVGEIKAMQVYANIARVNGQIAEANGSRFHVDAVNESGQPHGKAVTVSVDNQAVTCRDVPLHIGEILKGRYVEVIGLRLSPEEIAATRVDIYVDGRQVC